MAGDVDAAIELAVRVEAWQQLHRRQIILGRRDQFQRKPCANRLEELTAELLLPGVVIGIIWKLLLDESGAGIVAYAASLLGAHNPTFLSAPLPALFWVTIANIWRGTAFSMIMQYAGMKTVPPELYEAATVDGAGALQKFRYITLPSLRGILLINLVLITIATLNTFDMVLPLTGGGPGRATEVVALYIYHLVFSEFQFGRGAAVAVVLMAIGLILSACYARMLRKERTA